MSLQPYPLLPCRRIKGFNGTFAQPGPGGGWRGEEECGGAGGEEGPPSKAGAGWGSSARREEEGEQCLH